MDIEKIKKEKSGLELSVLGASIILPTSACFCIHHLITGSPWFASLLGFTAFMALGWINLSTEKLDVVKGVLAETESSKKTPLA